MPTVSANQVHEVDFETKTVHFQANILVSIYAPFKYILFGIKINFQRIPLIRFILRHLTFAHTF